MTFIIGFATMQRDDSLEKKPCNRQQTEEWKGWMQIMFLLYHYYAAVETYNAIRTLIAAYVWMTGERERERFDSSRNDLRRRDCQPSLCSHCI